MASLITEQCKICAHFMIVRLNQIAMKERHYDFSRNFVMTGYKNVSCWMINIYILYNIYIFINASCYALRTYHNCSSMIKYIAHSSSIYSRVLTLHDLQINSLHGMSIISALLAH